MYLFYNQEPTAVSEEQNGLKTEETSSKRQHMGTSREKETANGGHKVREKTPPKGGNFECKLKLGELIKAKSKHLKMSPVQMVEEQEEEGSIGESEDSEDIGRLVVNESEKDHETDEVQSEGGENKVCDIPTPQYVLNDIPIKTSEDDGNESPAPNPQFLINQTLPLVSELNEDPISNDSSVFEKSSESPLAIDLSKSPEVPPILQVKPPYKGTMVPCGQLKEYLDSLPTFNRKCMLRKGREVHKIYVDMTKGETFLDDQFAYTEFGRMVLTNGSIRAGRAKNAKQIVVARETLYCSGTTACKRACGGYGLCLPAPPLQFSPQGPNPGHSSLRSPSPSQSSSQGHKERSPLARDQNANIQKSLDIEAKIKREASGRVQANHETLGQVQNRIMERAKSRKSAHTMRVPQRNETNTDTQQSYFKLAEAWKEGRQLDLPHELTNGQEPDLQEPMELSPLSAQYGSTNGNKENERLDMELMSRIRQLETHVKVLQRAVKEENSVAPPMPRMAMKRKKKFRPIDFNKYTMRHVALKIMYLGHDYTGYAGTEEAEHTIERELFEALIKCKLIESKSSLLMYAATCCRGLG
ncbi:PUS3-like protein [Mya arenaria]|uniref:PUS3-like protein n=1 Tax=Mya arenaria TaxID=6604 RepID=A0ABY7EXU9_MYAAR|nr:PUS3-like protein [Mya arenaria]